MGNETSGAGLPGGEFVIEREYAVSREVLFELWTQCRHLKQWFGPKGFTMLHCDNDFRLGGRLRYCLKAPDGMEMWGQWLYREITPPERLVTLSAFTDAAGAITRHPYSAQWPLQTLGATTFTEHNGKTRITVTWSAFEATPAENMFFAQAGESMQQGWSGTFEQLEAYLAQLGYSR